MNIYCLGDSVTSGNYDFEGGGWCDRLKRECMVRSIRHLESNYEVYNLGIGGETTRGLRDRLSSELNHRLNIQERSITIIGFGANDSAVVNDKPIVPIREFVENLSWASDEVRRFSCDILFVNITPLAPIADGTIGVTGRLRSNTFVNEYNEAMWALSNSKSVPLIDVNTAFRSLDPTKLFVADGIHPNATGHDLIHKLVSNWLFNAR